VEFHGFGWVLLSNICWSRLRSRRQFSDTLRGLVWGFLGERYGSGRDWSWMVCSWGDLLCSGGLAAGYNAETIMYVVYQMACVLVVPRCVGSEGEGER